MLEESTELVERLWANAAVFQEGMKELGFDTGHSQTPIVPVMLGEAPLAQEFSRRLFAAGVFAMAIGFPTVPRGKAYSSDELGRSQRPGSGVGPGDFRQRRPGSGRHQLISRSFRGGKKTGHPRLT